MEHNNKLQVSHTGKLAVFLFPTNIVGLEFVYIMIGNMDI